MRRYIPHILTLGRFVLTVVFLVIILDVPYVSDKRFFLDIAFVIFVVAGVTDIVDGAIARKLNVESRFGRITDPLVDKILVCGAFICFAVIGEPKLFDIRGTALSAIQWSVAGVLTLREVYVTALRHIAESRGVNFAATTSGKVKMLLQSFAIGAVLVKAAYVPTAAWGNWAMAAIFILMLTVTVISGVRATQRKGWRQANQ
jgi:CDP-diacylglycerol--glycerol-3-phosphate 3-phosphatidyltransferase